MNFKELSENLGLDENEFIEIVELFVETSIADIERLESALKDNNASEASEAAHSLKGASGNLGFAQISEIAAKAEKRARQNDIADLADVIITLKEQIKIVQTKLSSI